MHRVLKPTMKQALGCCRALLCTDSSQDGHPMPCSPSCASPICGGRLHSDPSWPLCDPALNSGIRMDNSWHGLLQQGAEQDFVS